jgi:hypothetical protein
MIGYYLEEGKPKERGGGFSEVLIPMECFLYQPY